MGNWHCVPNGCARVVYREYLPPGIRYRYPGEDWQYVDGDDWDIDEQEGICFTGYLITFDVTVREYWIKCDRNSNGYCTSEFYIAETNDTETSLSIETFSNMQVLAPPYPDPNRTGKPRIASLDQQSFITLADWEVTSRFLVDAYRSNGSRVTFHTLRRYGVTDPKFNYNFIPNSIRNRG